MQSLKRRAILAALAVNALLFGVWCRSGRGPSTPPVAIIPAETSPTAIVRPSSGGVAPSPAIEPASAPAAPSDAPEARPRTTLSMVQQYADSVCLCADLACVDKLRDEYNQSAGHAIPVQDARALHDGFERAGRCINALSGPGG
jgi:hypothetical protein